MNRACEEGVACLVPGYGSRCGGCVQRAEFRAVEAQSGAQQLASAGLFNKLAKGVELNHRHVWAVNGVLQFNIKPNGVWTVDLKHGGGSVYTGIPQIGTPDVTLSMADATFVDWVQGKLDPQRAVQGGVIGLKGSVAVAQRFNDLLVKARRAVAQPPPADSGATCPGGMRCCMPGYGCWCGECPPPGQSWGCIFC